MKPPLLSESAVAEHLKSLPGWESRKDRIVKTFKFPDFVHAFGWMTSVALVVEKMNHHPEWQNVYGTVSVELSTHDAGGITEKDVNLAKAMNELAP